MKQANEVVCQIGLVITRIKLFSKSKKRVWIVMKVIYFKYGLSIGQIVLLKVVIKTAAGRSVGGI